MAGFLLATVELCLAAHLALKLMKHLFRAAWHYSYNTFHLSLRTLKWMGIWWLDIHSVSVGLGRCISYCHIAIIYE